MMVLSQNFGNMKILEIMDVYLVEMAQNSREEPYKVSQQAR
jgi:hypothetical protein